MGELLGSSPEPTCQASTYNRRALGELVRAYVSSKQVRVRLDLGGRGGGYFGRSNHACGSGFVNKGSNRHEQREAPMPVEAKYYK
ncbi:hypothetical protein PVK06_031044 [Gossypium arboreum]|uniref:Uncharacterized protein n=1 Tax=Gossypium arboreum TaxID=29729 RepID=A0ABR0NPY4_GOSAR|nr:hypothetical protein PVK06_031044 [Gossypium arboreum]